MLNKKVNVSLIYLTLLLCFLQSVHASSNNTFVKKEGRITGTSEASTSHVSRLVDSIELKFEWWTLLDQPVEYYTFKWVAKDSLYASEPAIELSEAVLSPYPKLLARYKALKPINVTFSITFDSFAKTYGPKNTCFYSYGIPKKQTRVISPNTLLIGQRGQWLSDTAPRSPINWKGFIHYQQCHTVANEQILQNTFSKIDRIVVNGLHEIIINDPLNEINAIARALLRKQHQESKEVTKNTEIPEETATSAKSDAFWQGENNSDTHSSDKQVSFWQDKRDQAQSAASHKDSHVNQNFWSGAEKKARKNKQNKQARNCKIKTSNQQYHVIDNLNNLLVAPTSKQIIEYNKGAVIAVQMLTKDLIKTATEKKREAKERKRRARSNNDSSDHVTYYLTLGHQPSYYDSVEYTYLRGYINQQGDWLMQPEQLTNTFNVTYKHYSTRIPINAKCRL